MALSELRDQVFFVAWIAFEFELKVLADLEFNDKVFPVHTYIVLYHLGVLVKFEEIGRQKI